MAEVEALNNNNNNNNNNNDDDDQSPPSSSSCYAHRHIPAFLALPLTDLTSSPAVQIVQDGSRLTAAALKKQAEGDDEWTSNNTNAAAAAAAAASDSCRRLSLQRPILVTDTAASIGMRLPRASNKKSTSATLTVRDLADSIGHAFPVHVIDVKHQQELEGWTFADLVDYFEDEERLRHLSLKRGETTTQNPLPPASSHQQRQPQQECRRQRRPRRQAATKAREQEQHQQQHLVLNQISLEFSKTPLANRVRSPAFVRELDWIDHAWSPQWRNKRGIFPAVQYYCLTSAAGCYTDFHLDFGGTSVWYHVASGQKVFLLIPPTQQNLQVYEEWLCRTDQAETFLYDLLPLNNEQQQQVLKITLQKDQTLIIPSGWIHSVYTPEDSIVFGGNFMHGLDMELQLQVNSLEVRSHVRERFRFPFFVPLQFYAGGMYLQKLRRGNVCQREVEELPAVIHALEEWWKMYSQIAAADDYQDDDEPSIIGAAREAAKLSKCESVDAFLDALRQEHARVVRDGISPNTMVPKTTTTAEGKTVASAVPKIRLKLSSSSSTTPKKQPKCTTSDDTTDSKTFRIQLSPESSKAATLPSDVAAISSRKKKQSREDTHHGGELVDEQEVLQDDEWRPSQKKRKSPSPATAAAAAASSRVRGPTALPRSPRVSKKPKTTARQRLLKKVGY